MNSYDFLLYFIVFIKILYLFVIFLHVLYKFDFLQLSKTQENNIEYSKEFIEDFYFFLMSIMIYSIFSNTKKIKYTFTHFEVHLLFFFAIILCIHLFEVFIESLRNIYKEYLNKNKNVTHLVDTTNEIAFPIFKGGLKVLSLLG